MNLTIDAGNTAVKMVIFKNDHIRLIRSFKTLSTNDLKSIFSNFAIRNSILSSVIKKDDKILSFLRSNSVFIPLNKSTKLPIKNKYKTPGTLGSDRLASVTGAHYIFPGKNILVIDAGTCIKYDFINAKKEYIGGSISPGLRMRFTALHNFTNRLPLIQPGNKHVITGTNTKDSILSGVQSGIIHEMNGFIDQYKKKIRSLQVVMTGGDAPLFAEHIKSSIFASPNLIHIGLHEILKYNAEEE